MQSIFYSPKSGGFYPTDLRAEYDEAGTWPDDAMEISAELHAELRVGLDSGKRIVVDDDGRLTLKEPLPPSAESLARAARAQRDVLLAQTDYRVMPDYPQSDTARTAVLEYRQKLRDLPKQKQFPIIIDWPVQP